jgi:hypothetical protein
MTANAQFAITDHKGFQITFANGVTVSVQWGPYNYCEGYWDGTGLRDHEAPAKSRYWKKPDAEVALWREPRDANGWLTKEAHAALNNGADCGDDVLPALKPDEVLRYLVWAAAQPPTAEVTP